jgi:ADP-ribosylglycohydrolase
MRKLKIDEIFKIGGLYFTEKDIDIEIEQSIDEGKNINRVKKDFNRIKKLLKEKKNIELQNEINALFDRCFKLPTKKTYKYKEPLKFEEIKKEWRELNFEKKNIPDDIIKDKIYGGWYGRCAGCLLGKPIEGWTKEKIENYLKDTNQFPLKFYIRSDFDQELIKKYGISKDTPFINNIKYMVEDDDLNYTVFALLVIERFGNKFTSYDYARTFLERIPILKTYTAERISYKNLVNLISPEISANFRNPYREWIGAQIRADFYGYINPGMPEKAVELVYKDASVTHIKNGIYGAMFVSAMLSISFCESDRYKIIKEALNFIPNKSRLFERISEIIYYWEKGIDYEEVSNYIHKKWNERNLHHWCHVISNAEIVVVGLLWGMGNFGESICKAVQVGFDTDCNGATTGSIMGTILGKKNLPEEWIIPLNDTLETGISNFSKIKISELAERTYKIYKKLKEEEENGKS